MQQYLDLLQTIKEKGTIKEEARKGMPGTISLFGYQFRHNLKDGFPLLTTKKLSWNNIVYELLWFLKGDTNIKYLVDNGCNIWNEDAYNYYLKKAGQAHTTISFDEFIERIKKGGQYVLDLIPYTDSYYVLGDCGVQYGELMRSLKVVDYDLNIHTRDQVKELIKGLKSNPMSRRHIISNWNLGTLDDMALNACHTLVQFNCRPIPWEEKLELAKRNPNVEMENLAITEAAAGNTNFGYVPQYYLDCQLYQRSADSFLGVPYNIASYALMTHIFAKITNMVPGELVHTFGDVHIYDNHKQQVDVQLARTPKDLPTLKIVDEGNDWAAISNLDFDLIEMLGPEDFIIEGYNPHPSIKGKLSTGLK